MRFQIKPGNWKKKEVIIALSENIIKLKPCGASGQQKLVNRLEDQIPYLFK